MKTVKFSLNELMSEIDESFIFFIISENAIINTDSEKRRDIVSINFPFLIRNNINGERYFLSSSTVTFCLSISLT
jgi:hypothetical protein